MIGDCNLSNLGKNQVSAVFHSRAIRRSVLPKFRELCKESPCLCPLEGHKHGGRHVTKHLSLSFAFTLELRHIEINASSSASTVQEAKTKAITSFDLRDRHFWPPFHLTQRESWRFVRALLQKEEPRRAKTMSNVMFL